MLKIRRFLPADLERVMKIERDSFLNREPWSRNYFEGLYQKCPEGFLVAENGGGVRGYTIGQTKNKSAEIISLAVAPAWRKKEIGTKLANFLINSFKEKNIKEIFLHVRTKNKKVISFYQNLDFEILKTIKNYYRNDEDVYLMLKEI